jgi:hypothetical protein
MLSNDEAVRAFANGRDGRSKHIFHEGNKLYDYGHHFVMAVRLSDGKFLINGDKYSSTTARHVGICLRQLMPHEVIPFSALGQVVTSGQYDQIKIIASLGDIWNTRKRMDPKTREMVDYQEHQLGAAVFEYKDKHYLSGVDDGARKGGMGYFLVELPEKVSSVTEAFESLLPIDLAAEDQENQVWVRQGEFFFIPMRQLDTRKHLFPLEKRYNWGLYDTLSQSSFSTRLPTKEKAEETMRRMYEEFHGMEIPPGRFAVHRFEVPETHNLASFFPGAGTGNPHNATEIRTGPGGAIFARGRVRHPQHKDMNLGKIWHRVVVNRAVQSFNARGNVD